MSRLPWAVLAVTAAIAVAGMLGVLLADYVP